MVLISNIIKYIFVVIIYAFIFSIVKLIYLDISDTRKAMAGVDKAYAYLKLISLRERLPYKVQESYGIKESVLIGTNKSCNISINDPELFGEHAQIYLRDGMYYIRDLNKSGKTYLNGRLVSDKPARIVDSDKVSFGKINFIFIDNVGLKGGRGR